jgi:hypothetical protein
MRFRGTKITLLPSANSLLLLLLLLEGAGCPPSNLLYFTQWLDWQHNSDH